MLANFKITKVRSKPHRRFIASLSCMLCGRKDVQAAHIRSGNRAGIGLKSGDDCCVPLCCTCHCSQHEIGEKKFWHPYGGIKKATELAKSLYAVTGDEAAAMELIERFR